MICVVCKGSGNLLTTSNKLQWWNCPGCGGAGVHFTGIVPPTLVINRKKKKHG